jgi:hypothetical protein
MTFHLSVYELYPLRSRRRPLDKEEKVLLLDWKCCIQAGVSKSMLLGKS